MIYLEAQTHREKIHIAGEGAYLVGKREETRKLKPLTKMK